MGEPGVAIARLAWLLVPFTTGPALAVALDPRAERFRTTASILLWLGWAFALGAMLVPRTVSLTIVRTIVPAAVVATAWAALAIPPGTPTWKPALALGWSVLAATACFSPVFGDAFVNGSAYGSERRMALRVPGALMVVAPLSWIVAVAGATAGPLLLAAGVWVPGAVALVVGVPAAVVAVRALHGLSRRWVVLVPAGLVLHDPFGLPDAVMFPRRMIARLGPAETGTDAMDVTQRSPGLALVIELTEPLPIGVRVGRQEVGSVDTDRLLFTPTRPGALLAAAAERRIAVG